MCESEDKSGTKKALAAVKKKLTFSSIIKFVCMLIIAVVYVLILGRIYLSGNHGVMDRFSFDKDTVDVYNENTEFLTQTHNYTMDNNGYYKISNFVYLPEYGELQINVRYNDSTLDVFNEIYPENNKNAEPFVFVLWDGENLEITDYEYIIETNLIYNFRKLKFDNIDFENIDKLYLTVVPSVDLSRESQMAVTFEIYNKDNRSYKSELKIKFGSKPDIFNKSPLFEISG